MYGWHEKHFFRPLRKIVDYEFGIGWNVFYRFINWFTCTSETVTELAPIYY